MKQAIQCDLHDYFEITCMFHYDLELQLKNSDLVSGVAGTLISRNSREFIVLEQLDKTESRNIVALDEVKRMTVLTPNARFREILF